MRSLFFACLCIFATPVFALPTSAQVFAYAVGSYPSLFSGSPSAGNFLGFDYRYYPSTGNYLAVSNGTIYIFGPVSGNQLTPVGTISSFENLITTWEKTQNLPPSFPFQNAMKAFIINGYQRNFSISYTSSTVLCSGSGTRTNAPANSLTTFKLTPTQSVPAVASAVAVTYTWTNCNPTYNTSSKTEYYDPTSYAELGSVTSKNYSVYKVLPVLPTSVQVGGAGIVGSSTDYTDSTQIVYDGRSDSSYVVTAGGSSTTATITLIYKNYDKTGALVSTSIDVWSITTAGVLTPISSAIQVPNGAKYNYTFL